MNIPFIIFIFWRLQKMEGNPNLSCSGPPSLIGPACFRRHSFLQQIPKQSEEMTNAPQTFLQSKIWSPTWKGEDKTNIVT